MCALLHSTGYYLAHLLIFLVSAVSLVVCQTKTGRLGGNFFFFWCKLMGHTIYAVPFVWAQAASKRLLGCQDSDLADLVNLQSCFFPPMVPSCWVSPKISALPCLSIHALLLPKTTEIVCVFSVFFLCPPPLSMRHATKRQTVFMERQI